MSDTPETDANVASLSKTPDCFCEADHARTLERQRDAYAKTLQEIHQSGMVGNVVATRHPKITENAPMEEGNERNGLRKKLKSYWVQSFKVPATKHTISLLFRYAQEHGEEAVGHWIEAASSNEIPANQALRYITAIRPKKDLEDDY